jgi:negative regulator of sigma E activity
MTDVSGPDGPTDPTGAAGPGDERSLLSGYLDGELTRDEQQVVDARLASSAEWRAELQAVRTARTAVRGLAEREAPLGFWERVTAAVAAADDPAAARDPAGRADTDAQRRRRGERAGERNRVVAWVAAAAAAAVIVAVFLIPGREQVRPDVTAVATQHAASSSELGDPISGLVPLGPLQGRR